MLLVQLLFNRDINYSMKLTKLKFIRHKLHAFARIKMILMRKWKNNFLLVMLMEFLLFGNSLLEI